MEAKLSDEYYMRLALEMARHSKGQTGVNPLVGCVIVKGGRIVGMGSHLAMGEEHAEIHALNMARSQAKDSTVYVTLEPCTHHGRTPPCCDRLIQAGIKRAVIACEDPNPLVCGKGVQALRKAGIDVKVGVLEEQARELNEVFFKYIRQKTPFVTLKTASTLDGKIATQTGDSKWITGEKARSYVHMLRHQHQAIMVGVNTILYDDPLLTSRAEVPSLQPIRIIVDSRLRIPEQARVLNEGSDRTILLTTSQAPSDKEKRLKERGVQIIRCGDGPKVDLRMAMRLLGEREIASVLLEGGGRLNGAMLEAGLVDKIVLFFAPKIVGGIQAPGSFQFSGVTSMNEAIRLKQIRWEVFGEDFCIVGYPAYERK